MGKKWEREINIKKLHLIDYYRIPQPIIREVHILFKQSWNIYKLDCVSGHKESLGTLQRNKHNILSPNEIKLEIINQIWKLKILKPYPFRKAQPSQCMDIIWIQIRINQSICEWALIYICIYKILKYYLYIIFLHITKSFNSIYQTITDLNQLAEILMNCSF